MAEQIDIERLVGTAPYEHIRIRVVVEVPRVSGSAVHRIVEAVELWSQLAKQEFALKAELAHVQSRLARIERNPIEVDGFQALFADREEIERRVNEREGKMTVLRADIERVQGAI